ncbi:serine hydrolase domain-containing protein [Cytobacillus gottheilii]|uniref:Beta-lactamase family protein n=1 Tax=Cytobacillus gottheilii TaxID=859144 RepID=A0ABX8F5F7_9BACI|nr:serine hydrolase domain-containing protein [Cytobacillus gottheilii]QVY59688.1 beta-lactamase family protein [Cytobacillus gottheilii]
MKRYLVILYIFLTIVPSFEVSAQNNKTDKINEYIKDAMDQYQIPGAALTIIDGGVEIINEQWGILSNGEVVTDDTPFLTGSLSKPFTALAILILAEEGKIELDQSIDTYIPEFKYVASHDHEITVYHLLRQTSGISQYDGLKVTDRENTENWDISAAIKELSGVKLAHSPGEKYEYNSANYLLLGEIVEHVSGESFGDFLVSQVFKPLEMNHTGASVEQVRELHLVPGFESWFGKPVKSEFLYDPAGAPYGYIASTATDLTKFLTFLLEGNKDIISEEGMRLFTSLPEDGNSYGMGWHFNEEGRFLFHGGATRDFRAEMYFRPEIHQAAILLTNKYHSLEDPQVYYIMNGIRDLLIHDHTEALPDQSLLFQWILLAIIIFLIILAIMRIMRKSQVKKRYLTYFLSTIFVVISLGAIPMIVITQQIPWRSFQIFAPDLAFLVYCIMFLFLLHAVIPLKFFFLKDKSSSIAK